MTDGVESSCKFLRGGEWHGNSIVIEHRPDQLLQLHQEEGLPPGTEGTFIERVTFPTRAALLAFLDETVVGKEFETEAALKKALATWPEYATDQANLDLHKDFGTIAFDANEGFIYCGESPGGPFVIGLVQQGEK